MICTTALTWQPAENIKVDDKKNKLEKDCRNWKRQTSDEQLSKGKGSSERQMEAVHQGFMRHRV